MIQEDIYEVRLKHLNDLIATWGQAGLARKMGWSQTTSVSLFVQRKRQISEKTARKVEEVFGLPYGSMDYPEDIKAKAIMRPAPSASDMPMFSRKAEGFTPSLAEPSVFDINIPMVQEAITLVAHALEAEGIQIKPEKLSALVSLVLMDASAKGAIDNDYVTTVVSLLK